ncbi:MAG: DUF1963 domain-containing protein [Bacteroidales bacterium]|nr:DUF1963 domain-containing protein [Bacteroidales bacterium]
MAIQIHLEATETELFCSSKWWGDPDFPADMEYPVFPVEEDGQTYDYPLTFVCQIDCADLESLDPDGRLPHEGMLYVFAALDAYAGYDSPVGNGPGPWPKGQVVVKYTRHINFETFRACMLVDDEDQPLTEPALRMTFSSCADDASVTRLLGGVPGTFLQIVSGTAGLDFGHGGVLLLDYEPADLERGFWKRVRGRLETLPGRE